MGKKKRHHKRSRSRSRSRSPHSSKRRGKRSDSDDEYRRDRRHHSSSEDSRERHHRSPDRVSRRKRSRRSPSRSRSREKRHKSERSGSRERSSRARSRSRDRRGSRRRRSHSRNSSRERSSRHSLYSSRRDDSRERRGKRSRSHSVSGSRRSRSRDRGNKRSVSPSLKSHQSSPSVKDEGKQEEMRDIAKDIPNFDTMTPAERIRAKIKLMLEKSTSSSANQSPVSMPTPSQLASIESDAFESVSFSSTRLPGKSEETENNGLGRSTSTKTGRFDTTTVDPSEYEPQVVDLQDTISDNKLVRKNDDNELSSQESESSSVAKSGTSVVVNRSDVTKVNSTVLNEESVKDKKAKWLQRLKKFRETFVPPPQ